MRFAITAGQALLFFITGVQRSFAMLVFEKLNPKALREANYESDLFKPCTAARQYRQRQNWCQVCRNNAIGEEWQGNRSFVSL
jgi:hypothetical protein